MRQVQVGRDPDRDLLRVLRVRPLEGGPAEPRAGTSATPERPAPAPQDRAQRVHRVRGPLPGPRPLLGRLRRAAARSPAPSRSGPAPGTPDARRVPHREPPPDRDARPRRPGGVRGRRVRACAAPGRPPGPARSISAWSAKPARAKSRRTARRLRRILALGGGPPRPVQLAGHGTAAARRPARACLRLGDVLEQPAHAQRHRLLRERRGQPQEPAAPAPPPLPLRRTHASPTSRRARAAPPRRARAGARPPAPRRPASSSSPSGRPSSAVRPVPRARAACALTTAGRRSTSTRTTPQRGVLEQRLAQRDGPLQVDLRVHLAEGAVHPGGLPVGPRHPGGLGPYEHPPAVLASAARTRAPAAPARAWAAMQPVLRRPARRRPAPPTRRTPCRPTASAADQPRIRSASRFQWVITPSASNAHKRGVHPVQQRGEQIRAVGAVRTLRTVPLGLVRPELVGGPTTPGSTHLDPLQAAASARTARRFAH